MHLKFPVLATKKGAGIRQDFAPFFFLYGCLKFLEEAEIVLEVVPEVLDLPFEHGNALNTHAEGKTAVLLAVNA